MITCFLSKTIFYLQTAGLQIETNVKMTVFEITVSTRKTPASPVAAPPGGDCEDTLCCVPAGQYVTVFFSDNKHSTESSRHLVSSTDHSVPLDICFLYLFLSMFLERFTIDDTWWHPSCEHAKAETVLKCVKHLELIFIPRERRNIQTLFV